MKRTFLLFASIIRFILAQRYLEKCEDQYLGDGYCDTACNLKRYRWDKGDCCQETCQNTTFQCGHGGYPCLENKVPEWFFDKIQLCFKQSKVTGSGQCGGIGFPDKVCAPPGEYTRVYLDEADDRRGGCRMSWALEKTDNSFSFPSWFNDVKLCFRWWPKNEKIVVCRGSQQESCVGLGEYTPEYIDDSDHWIGSNSVGFSCALFWKIQVPTTLKKSDSWVEKLIICLKFEPTTDMRCSQNTKTRYCATANRWTTSYYAGTDNGKGGCNLQWGLLVV